MARAFWAALRGCSRRSTSATSSPNKDFANFLISENPCQYYTPYFSIWAKHREPADVLGSSEFRRRIVISRGRQLRSFSCSVQEQMYNSWLLGNLFMASCASFKRSGTSRKQAKIFSQELARLFTACKGYSLSQISNSPSECS